MRVPLSTTSLACILSSLLLAAAGCGKSVMALNARDGGVAGTGGGAATGAGGAAGSTLGVGGAGGGTKIPIGSTECSDGIDNDHDGLVDSADPECTGPIDNDEGSFATGIPGDNVDPCKQDCFFDGNSGMGDDGCLWQLKCDPLNTNARCPYDSAYAQQHTMECSVGSSQSQKCISFCQKFVPNGCDCFGCCAVPGAPTPIRLDPTCTAKDFGDPAKCPPCTQVTQCSNPCDRCELCVGKTTVPPDCGPGPEDGGPDNDAGGGTPACSGYQSCIPGPTASCPAGTGCVTGCCIPVVP